MTDMSSPRGSTWLPAKVGQVFLALVWYLGTLAWFLVRALLRLTVAVVVWLFGPRGRG